MGKQVMSVSGSIDSSELGHCQIHEHIFTRWTPMAEKNQALEISDYEASLRELHKYRADGGCSLVDAQPVGAGRDASMLARLSRESGVFIIASTGYHLLEFYRADCWIHSLDEEGLYQLFLKELTEGMLAWQEQDYYPPKQRLDIRAGIVKAAIPVQGPVKRYKILLRAAARAAAAMGVPLMLHTEKGSEAEAALKICYAVGLPAEKIVVCHVDRQAEDFAIHERIAEQGVYLDYDTIGRFKYHSDEKEAELLCHMIKKGYAEKILLALDTTAARLTGYGGEIGLSYLIREFSPMLQRAGIAEKNVQGFTGMNCQHLFEDAVNK